MAIVEPPRKKTKYSTKFNSVWMKTYPWLGRGADEYHALCSLCKTANPGFGIWNGGERDIKRHGESSCHQRIEQATKGSQSLDNSFIVKREMKEKITQAEVLMTGFLVEHNIPISAADHLKFVLKEAFPDSAIAKGYAACRTKTTHMINNAISPSLLDITKRNISSTPFTVGVDASSDFQGCHNEKLLPLTVRYFDDREGVKVDFLGLPTIKDGTTDTMKQAMDDTLNGIDKSNMVGLTMDNTNANMGNRHSLKTEFTKEISHLYTQGCPAHIVHNIGKKASAAFKTATNFDIEDFLVDVFYYFDKSTKRKKELSDFCEFVNIEHKKILKHTSTRWLSLDNSVNRILQVYPALQSMFLSMDLDDRQKRTKKTVNSAQDRKQRLMKYFSDPCTEVYLAFYQSAMAAFTPTLKELQAEGPQIHRLEEIFLTFYAGLLSRCVPQDRISNPLTVTGLGTLQLDNDTTYMQTVSIGFLTTTLLRKRMNDPDSQGNLITETRSLKFREGAKQFYKQALVYAKKSLQFDDIIHNASVFDPEKRADAQPESLQYFIERFPDYVTYEEILTLESEFNTYRRLQDTPHGNEVDRKWIKMQKKLPVMYKMAKLMLALPHGNVDEERVFSYVTKNKTDFRANLGMTTLSSLLCMKQNLFKGTVCHQWKPNKSLLEQAKCCTYQSLGGKKDKH